MVLTRRGWSCFGAALGLVAGGRVLGLAQLWILATALLLLLVVAAAWTASRRFVLTGERRPAERLQVGVEGRVDLVVVNDGDRPSPTLATTDTFDRGRRSARFLMPPLRPHELARAAYRVPTDRRGRFELGPLVASLADPFGLSERLVRIAGVTEVIVYPRVHEILPLPELGGDDADSHAAELVGRPDVGGEFHLLREYDPGDDLRRVHWKSTARRDRLMVRQDESKRRAPVLVLLDVRTGAHDRPSFELAVEAVASVANALTRANRPFEVMATNGERLGHAGQRHLASVLDALAVIEPIATDRIVPALAGRRSTALVFVTGRGRTADARALDLMVRGGGGLAVVATGGEAGALPARRGRAHLLISPASGQRFSDAWNAAVLRWQRPDRTTLHAARTLR